MPSFASGIEGHDANEVVEKAMAKNSETETTKHMRDELIHRYKK